MSNSTRGRVLLACDRCRQRKSRCDGVRPCCSHCRLAGRECLYRPAPTNYESDVSVLARLTEAEARLQALEEKNRVLTASLLRGAHLPQDEDERPPSHQRPAQPPAPQQPAQFARVSDAPSTATAKPDTETSSSAPPNLHTAAAYKLLTCWPRLTINLTLPNLDSETYLTECDQADPTLVQPLTGPAAASDAGATSLSVWQACQALDIFYRPAIYHRLPLAMTVLLDACPGLPREHMLAEFAAATADQNMVEYGVLSCAQLLVLSLALRTVSGVVDGEWDAPATQAAATHACRLALQNVWTLLARPAADRVPLVLLLAYDLAYGWVRPFHARGLLQAIDPALRHMAILQADDPLLTLYARLHFLLESHALLKISSLAPTDAVNAPSWSTAATAARSPPTPSTTGTIVSVIDGQRPPIFYVENHVRLRILLNRILHLLYAPTKAYAQPHELADVVASLSAGLRDWYQAQAMDQQFVRDATIFSMSMPSMDLRLREIALRYFGCVFLLHRPVLYFFLHKDLEYTVRPPGNTRTLHVDREPWVLESCRDCIESAALIIRLSCLSAADNGQDGRYNAAVENTYQSWCGLQMLFAAYLLLLQVRSVPSLVPVFRNIGDIDTLLDLVEHAFARGYPVRSLVLEKSLAILRDERRNFDVASPVTHMT
ncbi:Zn(2)-C6 fungal-type DNA-binding domain protein [Niveomyces insectorum RCEF 264]|uniref:Zn(2)-C6 fungal-type DNA-binding domain protein n=1 Tax=Niveomyces insectorum RCEF 264 TaxID=1081102 RepID=A0A167W5Y4_9HYPO|nr:Zn(2)-C6 fungal-type DNA-binding domain protein [Niveomyces insectorum RCEF 264]